MKRILLLIALLVMVAIPVSAARVTNFQEPTAFYGVGCIAFDTDMLNPIASANCSIATDDVSGLYGMRAAHLSFGGEWERNMLVWNVSYPMAYSAATLRKTDFTPATFGAIMYIALLDSNGNTMDVHNDLGADVKSYWLIDAQNIPANGTRFEVRIISDGARLYRDGIIYLDQSLIYRDLPQNPSYIAWGYNPQELGLRLDDIIWGSPVSYTWAGYVTGLPYQGYYIRKDMINPAASGLYNYSNELIYSSLMKVEFARSYYNTDTRYLDFVAVDGSGTIWQTVDLGSTEVHPVPSILSGCVDINLTSFFNASPPYGMYKLVFRGETSSYSNPIWYTATGAVVAFDQDDYGAGNTAGISYSVSTGGYWDTTTYTYTMKVVDIYGNIVGIQPVVTQTGIIYHQFASDSLAGVYYATLYATPKSGGDPILIGYDLTEVTTSVSFSGYAMNAETGDVLQGVSVEITQPGVNETLTTDTDGFYESGDYMVGSVLWMNSSKASFRSFSATFTPLQAGNIAINISLVPDNPAISAIAIGGVAREPPYMRPIPSASVVVRNVTSGQYFTATTNIAGYYLKDSLTDNNWYDIWGSKEHFTNSTTYQKKVVAS